MVAYDTADGRHHSLGCRGREVIFESCIFGYWGSMLLDAYDTDGEGRKASFIEVHFQGK